MFSRNSLTQLPSLASAERRLARCVFHLTFAVTCLLTLCVVGYGQSTFGTILGTVKDPSGSLVPMAMVESHEHREPTRYRTTITNANGAYEFVNVEDRKLQAHGGCDRLSKDGIPGI